MRVRSLVLALTLAALQLGCAAGFRADGDHRGIGAGASVGPAPGQVYTNAEATRFTATPH